MRYIYIFINTKLLCFTVNHRLYWHVHVWNKFYNRVYTFKICSNYNKSCETQLLLLVENSCCLVLETFLNFNLFQSSNSSFCWSVTCLQHPGLYGDSVSHLQIWTQISRMITSNLNRMSRKSSKQEKTVTDTHTNVTSEQKSRQLQASFKLCRFRQLPEQVQAEYTPLTCSRGLCVKQVFLPEQSSLKPQENYSCPCKLVIHPVW